MRNYSKEDIQALEKYHRINLINTISGLKSVNLIGTQGTTVSNLAVFNSVVHIGANPPALGFIMRPLAVERHTYHNIKKQGFFTINQVHKEIYKQAHQTSAKYPADVSEFNACNFTEEWIDDFRAPFVKESHIKIGLTFVEEQLIEFNKTILIIGQIEKIILPDHGVLENGSVDHDALETITISGLYNYYNADAAASLPYAKIDKSDYIK